MNSKGLALVFSLMMALSARAQQYALYNTQTLFDAFESPSQKTFTPDSSRRIAFNFFIPNGGFTFSADGSGQRAIKKILYEGQIDARSIRVGKGEQNEIFTNTNTYLAMLRIFRSIQYNREIGFSWQIRGDARADVTNETFAIFDNYRLFPKGNSQDVFNNKAKIQSYHQFSISYRENYNRRLAFGAKLSYLSGIAYSDLDINKSSIDINEDQSYSAHVKGHFKSNFLFNDPDPEIAVPGIKNPGFAITLSANYKTKTGWFLLGNLKDLGMIRWTNSPYHYSLNSILQVDNAGSPGATKRLQNEIERSLFNDPTKEPFSSLINSKAEFLANKNFNNYQPNLLLIKNLFNRGGHLALIHNYNYRKVKLSLSTAYDFDEIFMLGGQFLVKSPNMEFFIGSDQGIKTLYTAKGVVTSNALVGRGKMGAALYLGFALKFGRILERRENTSFIPGLE